MNAVQFAFVFVYLSHKAAYFCAVYDLWTVYITPELCISQPLTVYTQLFSVRPTASRKCLNFVQNATL